MASVYHFRLLASLLLLAAASMASAGIDLTPVSREYTAEGIKFRQLIFRDGELKISYEPPRLWDYRSAGNVLQLTPSKAERADAAIQAVRLPAPQPLDEKGVAAAKQQFVSSLPPGGQAISILAEEQNPVLLKNTPSYEITASYQALGETFLRSTLFVNLPDTQLTFRLNARKADFDALHKAFRSSILSWQWIPPPPTPTVAANQPQSAAPAN